ncbi:phytoene/squalene synthase family protein [Oceanobacillus caeni]|uniref:squalene/phytoene synthase family protein n=1 Tax=Bacillaceae TaxID=186817 RepID=UPI0006215257|nr:MULTISPECIES: phytoene/squalene synthase family protein [Bacillaceae]KKE78842.1 phytoene synthase [Bacilli bacterium VT-13-104]PZD85138.1 phytoene/squalene synthase family protein [Bacilli bacterium]MBU8791250.1 phytoene/squalene synthase family protein [Oceanobacillus caeni]MCR1834902.1 phytoene/squalene synthase family protein [Oceanobacillus caeni]MED4475954.1 phytoene/squalene synthase family protein [Oceanobacillus caeni]
MSKEKQLQKDTMRVLKDTSRTFYIPISLLNHTLEMTVGSAYLCMRAIDEIEDHPSLEPEIKQELLYSISELLNGISFDESAYEELLRPYAADFPEVTLRMSDWLSVCPEGIVDKVKESTSIMAKGMAKWVKKDFVIQTKEDLDDYTYYVAGLVGVMLSDIWRWYDNTITDYELAIGYGRGLQAVNMLRNQDEDAERGVRFLPEGWTREDLFHYAEENLKMADQYIKSIKTKKILVFCKIPSSLAKKTLHVMKNGEDKMSRKDVESTVDEILNNNI